MNSLMTPEDVANILKISVKTVYAQSKKLGGFFPAGIKVLRFNSGVINGIVEGQGQRLAVSVPGCGGSVQLETLPDKNRSHSSHGRAKKIIEINGWKTDPSRHGL